MTAQLILKKIDLITEILDVLVTEILDTVITEDLDILISKSKAAENLPKFLEYCEKLEDQLDALLKDEFLQQQRNAILPNLKKLETIVLKKISTYYLKIQSITTEEIRIKNIKNRFVLIRTKFLENFRDELKIAVVEATIDNESQAETIVSDKIEENHLPLDSLAVKGLRRTIEKLNAIDLKEEKNLLEVKRLCIKFQDYIKFLTKQINIVTNNNPIKNKSTEDVAKEIQDLLRLDEINVEHPVLVDLLNFLPQIKECLKNIGSKSKTQANAKPAARVYPTVAPPAPPEEPAASLESAAQSIETEETIPSEAFKFIISTDTPHFSYDRNQKQDNYVSISKKIVENRSHTYRTKDNFAASKILEILANENYGLGAIGHNPIADLLEKAGLPQNIDTETTAEARYNALHELANHFRVGKTATADSIKIDPHYEKAILCLSVGTLTPNISLQTWKNTLVEIADIYLQNNNVIEYLCYLHFCLQTLKDRLPEHAAAIRNKAAEIFLNTKVKTLLKEGDASPEEWCNSFASNLESDKSLYLAFYLRTKYIRPKENEDAFKEFLCEKGGGLAVLIMYLNVHQTYGSRAIHFRRLFKRVEKILKKTCEILAASNTEAESKQQISHALVGSGKARSVWKTLSDEIKPNQLISAAFINCANAIFKEYSLRTLMNTAFLNAPRIPPARIIELGLYLINYASANPDSGKDINPAEIYKELIKICSKCNSTTLLHEAVLYTSLLAIHEKNSNNLFKDVIKLLEILRRLNSNRSIDSFRFSQRKSLRFQDQSIPLSKLISLWEELNKHGWSPERYEQLIQFYKRPPYDFQIPHKDAIVKALTTIYQKAEQRKSQAAALSTATSPASAKINPPPKAAEPKSEQGKVHFLDIEEVAPALSRIFTPTQNYAQFKLQSTEEIIATAGNSYVLLHQPIDERAKDQPEKNINKNIIELLDISSEQRDYLYKNKLIIGLWNNHNKNHWQVVFIKTGQNQIQSIDFWDPLGTNNSLAHTYKEMLKNAIAPNLDIKHIHVDPTKVQSHLTDGSYLWSCGYLVLAYILQKLSNAMPAEQIFTDNHPLKANIQNIVEKYKTLCSSPSLSLTLDLVREIRSFIGTRVNLAPAIKSKPHTATIRKHFTQVKELTYDEILASTQELILNFDALNSEVNSFEDFRHAADEFNYYLELLKKRIDAMIGENAFESLSNRNENEIIKKLYDEENLRSLEDLITIDQEKFSQTILELLKVIPQLNQKLEACQKKIEELASEEQKRRKDEDLSSLDLQIRPAKPTRSGEPIPIPLAPPNMAITNTENKSKKLPAISKKIANNTHQSYADKNGFKTLDENGSKTTIIEKIIKKGDGEGLGKTGKTPSALQLLNVAGFPIGHSETSETSSGKHAALLQLAEHYLNGYPISKDPIIAINTDKAVFCLATASIIPVTLQEKTEARCKIAEIYSNPKNRNFSYTQALTYLRFALDYVEYDAKLNGVRDEELAKIIRIKATKLFLKQNDGKKLERIHKLTGAENPPSWFSNFRPLRQISPDIFYALYLYYLKLLDKPEDYYNALRYGGGLTVLSLYLQAETQDENGKNYDFIITLLEDTYKAYQNEKPNIKDKAYPNEEPNNKELTRAWFMLLKPADGISSTSCQIQTGQPFLTGLVTLFETLENFAKENSSRITTDLEGVTTTTHSNKLTSLCPLNRVEYFASALLKYFRNQPELTIRIYRFLVGLYSLENHGPPLKQFHDAIYYLLKLAECDPDFSIDMCLIQINGYLEKLIEFKEQKLIADEKNLIADPSKDIKIAELTNSAKPLGKLKELWAALDKAVKNDKKSIPNQLDHLINFYKEPPENDYISIRYAADIVEVLTSEELQAKLRAKTNAENDNFLSVLLAETVSEDASTAKKPSPTTPPATPKAVAKTPAPKPVALKPAAANDDLDALMTELEAEAKEREEEHKAKTAAAKPAAIGTSLEEELAEAEEATKPAAPATTQLPSPIPGLTFEPTENDNHSFYNAVLKYLPDDSIQSLRGEVAQRIESGIDFLQKNSLKLPLNTTLQQYVENIRQDEPADKAQIIALMQILNRPIAAIESNYSISTLHDFYNIDSGMLYSEEPIFVFYNPQANHYDALKLNKPGAGKTILKRLMENTINQNLISIPLKIPPADYKFPPAAAAKKPTVSFDIPPPITIPGLIYTRVPGKGHCLYLAVGMYLGKDAQELRTEVADHLEENLDSYAAFLQPPAGSSLENHINEIRNGKEWAGDAEIEILMYKYQCPIVVVTDKKRITNIFSLFDQDGNWRYAGLPVFVYFNNINHHDGLVLDTEPTRQRTPEQILDYLFRLEINARQLMSFHKAPLLQAGVPVPILLPQGQTMKKPAAAAPKQAVPSTPTASPQPKSPASSRSASRSPSPEPKKAAAAPPGTSLAVELVSDVGGSVNILGLAYVQIEQQEPCLYEAVATYLGDKNAKSLKKAIANDIQQNIKKYTQATTLDKSTLREFAKNLKDSNANHYIIGNDHDAERIKKTIMKIVMIRYNRPIIVINTAKKIGNLDEITSPIDPKKLLYSEDPIFIYDKGIVHFDGFRFTGDATIPEILALLGAPGLHPPQPEDRPKRADNMPPSEMPGRGNRQLRVIHGDWYCNFIIQANGKIYGVWRTIDTKDRAREGTFIKLSGDAKIEEDTPDAFNGKESNINDKRDAFLEGWRANRETRQRKWRWIGSGISTGVPVTVGLIYQFASIIPYYDGQKQYIGDDQADHQMENSSLITWGIIVVVMIALVGIVFFIVNKINTKALQAFEARVKNIYIDPVRKINENNGGDKITTAEIFYVISHKMYFRVEKSSIPPGLIEKAVIVQPIREALILKDMENTEDPHTLDIDERPPAEDTSIQAQLKRALYDLTAIKAGFETEEDINLLEGARDVALALRKLCETTKDYLAYPDNPDYKKLKALAKNTKTVKERLETALTVEDAYPQEAKDYLRGMLLTLKNDIESTTAIFEQPGTMMKYLISPAAAVAKALGNLFSGNNAPDGTQQDDVEAALLINEPFPEFKTQLAVLAGKVNMDAYMAGTTSVYHPSPQPS